MQAGRCGKKLSHDSPAEIAVFANGDVLIMQQKEIEHIIKKIFKKLNQLLSQIKKDFEKDAIHDFRVEVKKFRAFLRLLALELEDADDLKLPKKLKEVYSSAGKVRDIQLQLFRINDIYKEENKPSEYLLLLQKEMKKWKKELQIVLEEKPLPKTEEKIISNLPAQLQPESIKNFFQQKAANVNALISARAFADDELHSTRKNIKDIIYIFKVFKEDARIPIPVLLWNKTELKKAENLAHELGLFNDVCIALSFVRPAWLNEINPEERKRLQTIRIQWNSEKESLKEKLPDKLECTLLKTTDQK